jgi:hypothetical protein
MYIEKSSPRKRERDHQPKGQKKGREVERRIKLNQKKQPASGTEKWRKLVVIMSDRPIRVYRSR